MRKIIKLLFSRTFIFSLAILIQLGLLVALMLLLGQYSLSIYVLFQLFSIITVVFVAAKRDNPIYKLAWVIPVALFPVFGWLLYLVFGRNRLSSSQIERLNHLAESTASQAPQSEEVLEEVRRLSPAVSRQIAYLQTVSGMPLCKGTLMEYLSPGEAFFARLCEELEKAERFILMEYFILEPGIMWDTVLEILTRKAKDGVEVKFLYDDVGCLFLLPTGYQKHLRKLGIEAYVFNAFRPSLDAFMSYRDHRKITVIDGNVGFTGGNNLADEYINAYEKHGHWKDSQVLLKGEAVWNLSVLFLQMWQTYDPDLVDYSRYRPTKTYATDGYVTVFGDSPLDNELVGEQNYMQMIQSAKRYVSFTTPYLILDNEMTTALCAAAQSGIQIQIVTPGIADKWYVHMVTRYNYRTLIEAGVEIYEYTGGFIHAKTFVCDDELAVVGTQNFDFRSFYLHFECNAWMYLSSTVASIRQDHISTIARSRRITWEECVRRPWYVRATQVLLNLFAPLM